MNKLTIFSRAILAIAIMFCVALPTFAYDFEVDGIYYKYLDETAKTVVVTYKYYYYDSYNEYSGSVTIPSSVTYSGTTYSVTSIGNYAFYNCTGLTAVTIPNSVTSIGEWAFYGCTGLTAVTIPNSVTSIGERAFYGCDGLTEITIPNSVTSIGVRAFNRCDGLTSVIIGNSVTSIGEWAFSICTGLTSVTIGNSVTSIGEGTFYWCTGLTELNYNAENCTSMGSSNYPVFDGCSNLKIVNIGSSVKTITDYAFSGCRGLTSITIPNSVTSIGTSAFSGCTGLTSVTIGNSVTSIGDAAFNYCSNLNTIISLNPTPPACANSNSFYNYSSATLYVPKDSYAKYFIDDVWGQFTNIKKIEILVSSITLNNSSIELDKGSTATLSATIAPSNATIKNIVWTSSNPQIATVDQSGKVTALSAGTATITAMANDGSNVSASCKVTVNSIIPTITLSQIEATLPVNEIMTLSYSITNSATKTATWSTSNKNVAYVKTNSDGSATIVGMADGVATITATMVDNGQEYSASCVVTVGVGGVEGVEMDNNAVEVSRYDIHGRLLSEPTPGINIVKMSDGTTRKEIVK